MGDISVKTHSETNVIVDTLLGFFAAVLDRIGLRDFSRKRATDPADAHKTVKEGCKCVTCGNVWTRNPDGECVTCSSKRQVQVQVWPKS